MLTQMAGRVHRLVAQSSTTTSLAGLRSPPIVPLPADGESDGVNGTQAEELA